MKIRSDTLWLVGGAAFVGLLSCLAIQGGCFGLGTEADGRPASGTPRGSYCGPIDHWYRWLLFPIGAAIIAAAVSWLLRRAGVRRDGLLALGVVVLLGIANAILANALNYDTPLT